MKGRLFRGCIVAVWVMAVMSCTARQSLDSPVTTAVATISSASLTPTRTPAPLQATATTTQPPPSPTMRPTAALKPPPRPTGISTIEVTSAERYYYTWIDPMQWYVKPQSFVGERLAFSALVHQVEEAEDETGKYTILVVYPETTRGTYPLPFVTYFGETITVTRGLWLDIFGVGSGWITSTDTLGQQIIVPLIAANGYITYTNRPHVFCDYCEGKQ